MNVEEPWSDLAVIRWSQVLFNSFRHWLGRELIEQFLPLVAWSTRWAATLTRGRGTPRSSR